MALHAYVLMTNHVHLLLTPRTAGISRLVNDHDLYVGLGASAHDRQCAYRNLFRSQIPEIDIHDICECLAYNYRSGNDRFREQVETTLGKRVGRRQRGRPSKHVDAPR